ncbi:MAG TPA: hypothetical protein VFU07_06350 [Candidatus Lumbricidophila sp.]|nr:hypothetical protein [Candidatus Lumbricidophila sp.]
MTTEPESGSPKSASTARTRALLGSGAAVAGAAIVIALVALVNNPAPAPAPAATSAASAASATPTPTQTQTPSASVSPTPAATASPTPQSNATEAPPVPITATAQPFQGVRYRVTALEAVDGQAAQPGEVAGPAIRFVVQIENQTPDALGLGQAVVNVYYGANRAPADTLTEPGGSPFPASVAAGNTASGTFVFRVPSDQRDTLTITVDLNASTTVQVFEGPGPK